MSVKKYIFFNSIRYWLFLSLVGVSLVPLALLEVWVNYRAVDNEFSDVQEKHLIVARNLSFALSRYARDARSLFEIIDKSDQSGEVKLYLQNAARSFSFRYLVSYDQKNTILKFIEFEDHDAVPLPDFDYIEFLRRTAGENIGSIVFSGITKFDGAPHFWILRQSDEGTLAAVLMRPDYVVQLQKSIAFGKRGHAMVVDQYGRVVAHPNPDWQATSKDASQLSVVKKMMARTTGVAEFFSPPMNADMIAGHTFVPETGWGIMVPQPIEELYENAWTYRLTALIIGFIGLAVAVVVGWWLSRAMSQNLSRLSNLAERVSQGDFSSRFHRESSFEPNEVTSLANAFNEMIGSLDRAESKLRHALQRAEAGNIAKSQFLATVSHEIRTPLNGVVGALELIEDTSDEAKKSEYVKIAMSSCNNLLAVVEDILDISSIEAGRIEIQAAEIVTADLIEELKHVFNFQAEEKGLSLEFHLSGDVPDRFYGDVKRIRQILINIIGNALKFTDSGHVRVKFKSTDYHKNRGSLIIEVKDTGCGIPKEDQEKIFDRFHQVDSSLTREKGGTGLGLAISKDLSALMGGDIKCESSPRHGTTFTIELPLRDAPSQAVK